LEPTISASKFCWPFQVEDQGSASATAVARHTGRDGSGGMSRGGFIAMYLLALLLFTDA
jgi:hypothetical protein